MDCKRKGKQEGETGNAMFVWSAVSKEEWNANQMANQNTKGLVEAENRNQVQYSLAHMHMQLNQALGRAYELPEILEVMDRDVKEFLKGELPKQDITMLLLRYLGT